MKTLRTVIVDDELKARKNLAQLIAAYVPEIKVTGEAGTVEEAVELIDRYDPHLVFLDIEMNNETGFDLLEAVGTVTFRTIFVTAHDEYAVRAFKYSAFDYILKPIDIEELRNSVLKLADEQLPDKKELTAQYQTLEQNREEPEKLVLPASDKMVVVRVEEVVRCESAGNYCIVHLSDGREIVASKNIKHFEELLGEVSFCRIHRAHLINLSYLKEYHKGMGGEVELKSGKILPVSRRKKKTLLDSILR